MKSGPTTTEVQKCSHCGADLPPDAPGGHCAKCLLQLGLASEPGTKSQAATIRVCPEPNATSTQRAGDYIGHYKLLQQLGEGGCGVVYMAQQQEPIRRRVALKVIKLGMDTKEVIARFEAERQALALMDHPHIAKVLDAGTTDAGRPFFVMELVGGIKITEYCDREKLTTPQRLELFIQVCQAVQHAHQKGIIHRDLKPSNILVTEQDGLAVPKIIDFGIAKATTGQQLTDKTLFTAFEQFIGTPAYMSPEQAGLGRLDIDTRSDIYSLGVLLYELLTGQPPFDAAELKRSALDQLLQTIREQEPPPPSTRLTSLARHQLVSIARDRQVEAARLASLVRGDLDWIVMKCLDKDRRRRYETANGLAMDIQRHLNNEPVRASPPSGLYRFQKSVRRNKLAYGATAAVGITLIAGLTATTWMFTRERRSQHEQSRLRVVAQRAQTIEARQKAAAQQLLYDSLLGQARATRIARQVGYRDRIFALLEQAKALDVPGKNLADLRREAAGALGDFVGLTPVTFTNTLTNCTFSGEACLDPSGRWAAFGLSDGTIELRKMPSGKEIVRLKTMRGWGRLCFNSTGDQLFALRQHSIDGPPKNAFLAEARGAPRLYAWTCDTDGRWRETERDPLPGAMDLLNSDAGVLALVVDLASVKSRAGTNFFERARLFNLDTEAFIAGYAVTNAISPEWESQWSTTPNHQLIAVETTDMRNTAASVLVSLYDWRSGRCVRCLQLPMFGNLSLSQDEKYLAWLSHEGGAIYTIPKFERIGQFKEFFPRGALLSANLVALPTVQHGRIRLWNLLTQEDLVLLDAAHDEYPVAFSSTETSLLTLDDRHARFYRLQTPERLDLPAHPAAVPGVAFSPDGTHLASVSKDRVVRVSDAMTGQTLWQADGLPGPGQCVSYSPDGNWLATGDYETGLVWIWNARNGRQLLQIGTNAMGRTWSVQFSPDGRYLATAQGAFVGIQTGIKIWRIVPGKDGETEAGLKAQLVAAWSGVAAGALFRPDGKSLCFVSGPRGTGCPFYFWDFDLSVPPRKTGLLVATSIQGQSFTPDGQQVLALSQDGEIVTLAATTGKKVSAFRPWDAQLAEEQLEDIPRSMSLSPDGSRLAVSSPSARSVNLWDPKTGRLIHALREEASAVYWLAWSPNSRRLAIARDDGTIAIWNLPVIGQILAGLGLNP